MDEKKLIQETVTALYSRLPKIRDQKLKDPNFMSKFVESLKEIIDVDPIEEQIDIENNELLSEFNKNNDEILDDITPNSQTSFFQDNSTIKESKVISPDIEVFNLPQDIIAIPDFFKRLEISKEPASLMTTSLESGDQTEFQKDNDKTQSSTKILKQDPSRRDVILSDQSLPLTAKLDQNENKRYYNLSTRRWLNSSSLGNRCSDVVTYNDKSYNICADTDFKNTKEWLIFKQLAIGAYDDVTNLSINNFEIHKPKLSIEEYDKTKGSILTTEQAIEQIYSKHNFKKLTKQDILKELSSDYNIRNDKKITAIMKRMKDDGKLITKNAILQGNIVFNKQN